MTIDPNDTLSPYMPAGKSGAVAAYAVTPSDTADIARPIRAITIGTTAGTISFISSIDGLTYTTGSLPVGTYPVFASRILATGTTAVGLTGWV